MKDQRLRNPVPIRLRRAARRAVLRAARRLRVSPAEVIRRAVDRKLPEWDADRGASSPAR